MTTRRIAVVAALAAAVAAAPGASQALAKGDDVRVSRKCSGPSTIKIKLKPDNGRLEVEAEVDQNRNGVTWHWALLRGSTQIANGTATTRAPSGSFSVRRLVTNRAGTDTITARATRSGETCTVTASI
jgi:hypothetical protein